MSLEEYQNMCRKETNNYFTNYIASVNENQIKDVEKIWEESLQHIDDADESFMKSFEAYNRQINENHS